jgi:hypothetical protein
MYQIVMEVISMVNGFTMRNPRNNGNQPRNWGNDDAERCDVDEEETGVVYENVDIWHIEVPGTILIRMSEIPNGGLILNNLQGDDDQEPKYSEECPHLQIEIRYYLPGEDPETVVDIIDDHGWPCGWLIIWKPMP